MSIEIEVGLENASKVKPTTEELKLEEPPAKGLANPRTRFLVFGGGLVLLVLLISLFLYYQNRESTDDAQVDGHITQISSKVYGRIGEVLVNDNQQVKAGQTLVKLDPRDLQAAVDQAKAQLALAETDAQSAGVDVPRTQLNTQSGTSSADAQLAFAQADLMRAQSTYDQARTSALAFAQANIEKSKTTPLLAQADLERYRPLMEKGEISKQQFDAAQANGDATASALKADQEKLAQAQRGVEIAQAQLDAAKARVDQARAGIISAKADTKQVVMRQADAQGKIA